MAEKRKLQLEIDKTLKRVDEGIADFDSIHQKVADAVNATQKEKFENELKKEIKKLQRQRDQLKAWQTSSDVKDKGSIEDARRKIEKAMERFKACERESKVKAFSKEGLAQRGKVDPQEKERGKHRSWIQAAMKTIQTAVDANEAEIETLRSKKGKQKDAERFEKLELHAERNRWHLQKLEQLLRRLENDTVDLSLVESVQHSVEYYVEFCENPTDYFDEEVYTELNLEDPPPAVAAEDALSTAAAVASSILTASPTGRRRSSDLCGSSEVAPSRSLEGSLLLGSSQASTPPHASRTICRSQTSPSPGGRVDITMVVLDEGSGSCNGSPSTSDPFSSFGGSKSSAFLRKSKHNSSDDTQPPVDDNTALHQLAFSPGSSLSSSVSPMRPHQQTTLPAASAAANSLKASIAASRSLTARSTTTAGDTSGGVLSSGTSPTHPSFAAASPGDKPHRLPTASAALGPGGGFPVAPPGLSTARGGTSYAAAVTSAARGRSGSLPSGGQQHPPPTTSPPIASQAAAPSLPAASTRDATPTAGSAATEEDSSRRAHHSAERGLTSQAPPLTFPATPPPTTPTSVVNASTATSMDDRKDSQATAPAAVPGVSPSAVADQTLTTSPFATSCSAALAAPPRQPAAISTAEVSSGQPPSETTGRSEEIVDILEASMKHSILPEDVQRHTIPSPPCAALQGSPLYFPSRPLERHRSPQFCSSLSTDCLFWILYNLPCSHWQLQAARELKARRWCFHKTYLWWLRALPPETPQPQNGIVVGNYEFYDFENSPYRQTKNNVSMDLIQIETDITPSMEIPSLTDRSPLQHPPALPTAVAQSPMYQNRQQQMPTATASHGTQLALSGVLAAAAAHGYAPHVQRPTPTATTSAEAQNLFALGAAPGARNMGVLRPRAAGMQQHGDTSGDVAAAAGQGVKAGAIGGVQQKSGAAASVSAILAQIRSGKMPQLTPEQTELLQQLILNQPANSRASRASHPQQISSNPPGSAAGSSGGGNAVVITSQQKGLPGSDMQMGVNVTGHQQQLLMARQLATAAAAQQLGAVGGATGNGSVSTSTAAAAGGQQHQLFSFGPAASP